MRRPFSHFQPLRSRHADVTFSHRRRQDGASNGMLYLGYPVSRAMSILPTAANVYSFGLGFSLSQRVVWNFRSLIFSFSQTWMNDNNSKKKTSQANHAYPTCYRPITAHCHDKVRVWCHLPPRARGVLAITWGRGMVEAAQAATRGGQDSGTGCQTTSTYAGPAAATRTGPRRGLSPVWYSCIFDSV